MTFSTKNLRNIDIEKLNHFYLIYREGSIAEASRKYSINIKILRHSLKTIEQKLLTETYYPNSKKFLPTPDGVNLYQICDEIINSLNKYDNRLFLENKSDILKQELIIVTTTTLAHYFLPSSIFEFFKKEHDISLKIYSGPEYITNNDFVFDILISPYSDRDNLIHRKLVEFEYNLYCSKRLKENLGNITSIQQIVNQDILLFTGEHLLSKSFIKNNNIKIVSNSYPFLINMCSKDQGILSCFSIKNFKKIYDNIDIIPIIDDYITEKETVYFSFNRLNHKIIIIEKFYSVFFNYLKIYKGVKE